MLPIPLGGLLNANTVKYVLIAGAAVGGILLISHVIHTSDQTQTQTALDASPEAQQANDLLKLLLF